MAAPANHLQQGTTGSRISPRTRNRVLHPHDVRSARPPSGECEHVLVPAIHNLLFIHREYDKDWCYKLLQTSPYPLYFLKKERDDREYCTISEKEMNNFMRATDPRIQGTRFIDPQKLKDKEGMPVRIIKKGPLYGITGKLMRYGSRHYVAIEMPQSTALLKVSYTWCEFVSE